MMTPAVLIKVYRDLNFRHNQSSILQPYKFGEHKFSELESAIWVKVYKVLQGLFDTLSVYHLFSSKIKRAIFHLHIVQ